MRRIVLIILICCAVMSLGNLFGNQEKSTTARLVQVKRADVHQIAAITGRLMYTEEKYLTAPASGIVSRVCVKEDQRISNGELLLCLDSTLRDQSIASVWQHVDALALPAIAETGYQTKPNEMVLRGDRDCTVWQLLVQQGDQVAAGTPVMRITSNQQRIMCIVPQQDAGQLAPGMWAWIYADGEDCSTALITDIGNEFADDETGLRYKSVVLTPQMHIDIPEGAAVDADVYLAGSDDVLSLPVEAITARQTVWWVNEGRCTEILSSR